MKFSKLSMAAGFVIAFALISGLTARANEDNQLTRISFTQAVQVPGHVLPAGTYEFVVASTNSNQDVVRIFNADGTQFIAAVPTVPTQRARGNYPTAVTLAQRPDGQPAALTSWFYVGTDTGHQFVYSKPVENELAQDTKQTFVGEHGIVVSSDMNGTGN